MGLRPHAKQDAGIAALLIPGLCLLTVLAWRFRRGKRCWRVKRGMRVQLALLAVNVVVTIRYYNIRTYFALLLEMGALVRPKLAVAAVLLRSTHVFVLRTFPAVLSSLLMLHHILVA